MADIKSPEERSRNMAAIRSKDTRPEVYFRKLLFSKGYRYRKNSSSIVGHPDIYMAKYSAAFFVNGCFWHRHNGCKYAYTPKTKTEYWLKKFENNLKRDLNVKETLLHEGIKCIIIWECSIKKMQKDQVFKQDCLNTIESFLQQGKDLYMEI